MMESDIEDLKRRNRMLEARLETVEKLGHDYCARIEAPEALTRAQQAEISSLKRSVASLGRFSF